ncbi:MAG: GNAT family N-acetyltransferase [Candidatus Tectomicrobia bacterium]|uniref:GNAT family N-acetyltransferase n=1 Tax=Tectimicrobiota bacterium TaxID=2528274 RepID=A0A932M0C0_UNCTE|nr:GNAT family N-acetyltransferase [Candidatus Tectomicrobia bacterium]
MEVAGCTMEDFHQIVSHIAEFWGSDRTLHLHHPMFVHEFGDTAYVVKDGSDVAAYLFGFLSQTEPTAYVHLVGVRTPYRRRGLARQLYEHFISVALSRGCKKLKAITTPGNLGSIAFHRALGMEMIGTANEQGIPVVRDYAGPGQGRVVFVKDLL